MKKLLLITSAICLLTSYMAFGQYIKLLDFAGTTNGKNPQGNLIFDGTFLYGMTSAGGTNDSGTIFKIKPDGTGYVDLLDFAGAANGSNPTGSLISDGTFLYGMTWIGGANDDGTIFKIKPDGSGFVKLLDFTGATNGSEPSGSLISDGTFLYGMTSRGGTNNDGVIFKIKPDGTGYDKLLDFAGATNGGFPVGSFISDGTYLYGMTYDGGTNSIGTIFKIKPDGTGYTKLHDFNYTSGDTPIGSLISDGTFLYGMTLVDGVNGYGVVFKIKPDGTGYVDLFDFNITNGNGPAGSLISDGTFLYAVTGRGGANNDGVIFKIKPDGTGYSDLFDFNITNGNDPVGSFISDGTFLYGMTYQGGANNDGVIFKFHDSTATCNASITGNTTLCAGQNTTLNALSGAIYSWNTGETTASIIVSPTVNTTYTVTATTGSCVATATTTVIVNPIPAITISGNTSICFGQNLSLSASGGITYSWSTGATTSSITASPTTNTTYIVVGSDGTCSDTVSAAIVIDSLGVNLTLVQDTANPLTWYGYDTITGGAPPYIYYWSFGDGDTSALPSPSHTYSVSGHYAVSLTVTDANGCTSSTVDSTYRISSPGIMQYLNINPLATGTTNLQTQNDFIISPNPTSGKFQVSSSKYQVSSVEIYNVMGEKVYELPPALKGANTISVILPSGLGQGIYFLQLKTEQGTATKKIIINK